MLKYLVMTRFFLGLPLILALALLLGAGKSFVQAQNFTTQPGKSEARPPSQTVDAVSSDLSEDGTGDEAEPSRRDLAQRRREYATVFAFSAAILVIALAMALVFRNRDAAAADLAALAAVGIAAMLQFTASKGIPMLLWPPPHLWLGTFAANFSLAVMFAAIGGTMLRPGLRRLAGTVVIAEIAWWGIPAFAGATGLTLSLARHRMDMDWLVFLGTAVGAVAAPAAGWATASLAANIADRLIPSRPA